MKRIQQRRALMSNCTSDSKLSISFTDWFLDELNVNPRLMRDLREYVEDQLRWVMKLAIPSVPGLGGAIDVLLDQFAPGVDMFMELALTALAFYAEIGDDEAGQQAMASRAEFFAAQGLPEDVNKRLRGALKLLANLDVIGNWDYKDFLERFFAAALTSAEGDSAENRRPDLPAPRGRAQRQAAPLEPRAAASAVVGGRGRAGVPRL